MSRPTMKTELHWQQTMLLMSFDAAIVGHQAMQTIDFVLKSLESMWRD
jgi:hypothetical protein